MNTQLINLCLKAVISIKVLELSQKTNNQLGDKAKENLSILLKAAFFQTRKCPSTFFKICFYFTALLRYSWLIMLCVFKVYSVTTWYMYIL